MKKLNNIHLFKISGFFEGLYFLVPIFVLFLNDNGIGIASVVFSQTLYSIGIFLGEVPTGMFADRYGQKTSLILFYIFEIIALTLIFLFPTTYFFLAMTFVRGIASSFSSGADEALLWETIKRGTNEERSADYKQVRATIESNGQIGTVIAALSGGLAYQFFGKTAFSPLIIATIIGTIISGVFIALLVDYHKEHQQKNDIASENEEFNSDDRNVLEEEGFVALFKKSLRLIYSNKILRTILAVSLLTFTGEYFLQSVYQPYFELNHVSGFWLGGILTIGSLLGALLLRFVHRIEHFLTFKNFVLLFALVLASCYLALAKTHSPVVLVIVYSFMIGIFNLISPAVSEILNKNIDSKIRATALSTISFLKRLFITGVYTLLGFVVAGFGTSNSFVFMALYLLVGGVGSFLLLYRYAKN